MALFKCTECGQQISDKAESCPNCGCPVEKKIVCSECGNTLTQKMTRCPQCGAPMEETHFTPTYKRKKLSPFEKDQIIKISVCTAICIILILLSVSRMPFHVFDSTDLIDFKQLFFDPETILSNFNISMIKFLAIKILWDSALGIGFYFAFTKGYQLWEKCTNKKCMFWTTAALSATGIFSIIKYIKNFSYSIKGFNNLLDNMSYLCDLNQNQPIFNGISHEDFFHKLFTMTSIYKTLITVLMMIFLIILAFLTYVITKKLVFLCKNKYYLG